MSWQVVARKDVEDAVRSYWLWGLTVLFVAFFVAPAYFFADRVGQAAQQQGAEASSDLFIPILAEVNAFFVPIIAIVLAYAAIAGERDDGTLKLHTRGVTSSRGRSSGGVRSSSPRCSSGSWRPRSSSSPRPSPSGPGTTSCSPS